VTRMQSQQRNAVAVAIASLIITKFDQLRNLDVKCNLIVVYEII